VLAGFVWTQLADVQQERHGLLTFVCTPKLPIGTQRGSFGNIGARERSGRLGPAKEPGET